MKLIYSNLYKLTTVIVSHLWINIQHYNRTPKLACWDAIEMHKSVKHLWDCFSHYFIKFLQVLSCQIRVKNDHDVFVVVRLSAECEIV